MNSRDRGTADFTKKNQPRKLGCSDICSLTYFVLKYACQSFCACSTLQPSWTRFFQFAVLLVRHFLSFTQSIDILRSVIDVGESFYSKTFEVVAGESLDSDLSLPAFELIYSAKGGVPYFARSISTIANKTTFSPIPDDEKMSKIILYFHGGCFCLGSVASARNMVTRIAEEVNASVLTINYRRAPEFPYPIPATDCFNCYKWLLDKVVNTSQVVLAGDSAGGALVIETLIMIRDAGLSMPGGCILISPWVDIFDTQSESMRCNARFDLLSPEVMPYFARLYAGNILSDDLETGNTLKNEENTDTVSVIQQDLHGLPPMLIEYGDCEVFKDQILRFADKARNDGVRYVEIHGHEEMVHVFQAFNQLLPEPSKRSFSNMRVFMEQLDSLNTIPEV
mmetsp:Transcript_16288/g.22445  ORF Transcript_16288/g.22445 Transcript_16288/m.22445 type:complete len:394 (-) Transcript_16288:46-1227(-)